jgi:PAS domain S-box-containing protein
VGVDVDARRLTAGVFHDVSERKEAEARQRRLQALVASSGEAIISAGLDGRIESWNPAAERLFGYSEGEMIGESLRLLLPGGSFAGLGVELRALFDGESVSRELLGVRKGGEQVEVAVTMSPLCHEDGEVAGVASIARDVTERNRTTARLQLASSRFAGAFEAASIGMALTGLDGRFLEVNAALCRLLGRDADALLASSFQELTHPDDLTSSLEKLRQALAGKIETFQQPKRYLLPGGGIVWTLLTLTIVRDGGGKPLHFVAQIEDITARKTAEGELRRYATQLESLSEQDAVTGLSNRHAFELALATELCVLRSGGSPCSVLLAGIEGDDSAVLAAAEFLQGVSRDTDFIAYLNHGELAVLLPGIDAPALAPIAIRVCQALHSRVDGRVSWATASAGDEVADVMRKARTDLGALRNVMDVHRSAQVPAGVGRLLELARRQLRMPVSFLAHLDGDEYVFERFAGEHQRLGVVAGDTLPLTDTHCQRMLGRIDSTVPDLATNPETRDLEVTAALGLRAYVGVPVRLRSGEIYGTLCAVDTQPHPELSDRHTELLTFLSELAAELIEDEVEQRAARRAEAGATGVRTLLVALEARDLYTGEHSQQVVALASAVAERLGLDKNAARDVEQVALLHDIGKVGIPDAILQKQGPLDAQEWQLMRQHPIVGERIIAGTPGLSHLAPAMRAEHERWDGHGYPDGLAAEQIPLASRITLACDALHAMTSDRPYRSAMALSHAREELQAGAGSQFDPNVIKALVSEIDNPTKHLTPAARQGPSPARRG